MSSAFQKGALLGMKQITFIPTFLKGNFQENLYMKGAFRKNDESGRLPKG